MALLDGLSENINYMKRTDLYIQAERKILLVTGTSNISNKRSGSNRDT